MFYYYTINPVVLRHISCQPVVCRPYGYILVAPALLLTCIANVSCKSQKKPTDSIRNTESEGYANLSKQEEQILDAVLAHWKSQDLVPEAIDYWIVRMYVWRASEDPVYVGLRGSAMTQDITDNERTADAYLSILSDGFKVNIHAGNAVYSYNVGKNDLKIVGGRLIVD